jgi:glycosyltransferase involved in cell wall biosynthesis
MKKVSVLLPTRGRYEMLVRSLESLTENCSDVNNIEILLAVDTDDTETTDKIAKLIEGKDYFKMFFYERKRYRGLHLYINDLCHKATGDSLMIWNDDAIISSKNWDLEIAKLHKENFCVLSLKVENMEDFWNNIGVLFPVIPKKWIEITNIWSPVPGLDSWIDLLSKRLGIQKKLASVVIHHDRFELTGNNNDETYTEGFSDKFSHSLSTPTDYPEMMEDHYEKLKNYIDSQK